ncbi:MAG: hypothetical protein V3R81_11010 [Gammaproteobacteria bacterium]
MKMNGSRRVLRIALTILILAIGRGCILQREPPPRLPTVEVITPTPTPTAPPILQSTPTATVEATDTLTATRTPEPTATPSPTVSSSPTLEATPSPATVTPLPQPTLVRIDVAEGFGVKMRLPEDNDGRLTCSLDTPAFAAIHYETTLELKEIVKVGDETFVVVWLPEMHQAACIDWRYVDDESQVAMRWRYE